MMPEALARENVGQMHLNHRQTHGTDRIVDGDGGVRVRARIDDDTAGRGHRLLDPVDQRALLVGLAEIDRQAEAFACHRAIALDIGQALGTIDARLARAEQVQVGTVEDEDRDSHEWELPPLRRPCLPPETRLVIGGCRPEEKPRRPGRERL